MRGLVARILVGLGGVALVALSPVPDAPSLKGCKDGLCTVRMTAPELLAAAEQAVLAQKYDQARPMLAALANAPDYVMERHFLQGYLASQTGELRVAEKEFRAVLRDRPDLTRARLELARVLLMEGKDQAADHHFRLAEQDGELPAEIEKTIRDARGVIRTRRNWSFNIDFGFAPDTNINGATDARTINLDFGGGTHPYTLDPSARRKSGLGQTAGANGMIRLRLKDGLAMRVDGNADLVNYKGSDADDISALIAAGPELTMKKGTRIAIQAVGYSHSYGGTIAQQGAGVRFTYQQDIGRSQRIGAQVDVRSVDSHFADRYDGTSYSAYLSYERVVHRSMISSATIFARRDDFDSPVYSSKEFGLNLGIGGELPKGVNGGLSAGISRALFDAPLAFNPTRKDWRFNARAYVGLRSVRVLGFSPSLTYNYSRVKSTLSLYESNRHRFEFSLARYF